MSATRRVVDRICHTITDPYCNAKILGHHLPGWELVQVGQYHVCTWSERDADE